MAPYLHGLANFSRASRFVQPPQIHRTTPTRPFQIATYHNEPNTTTKPLGFYRFYTSEGQPSAKRSRLVELIALTAVGASTYWTVNKVADKIDQAADHNRIENTFIVKSSPEFNKKIVGMALLAAYKKEVEVTGNDIKLQNIADATEIQFSVIPGFATVISANQSPMVYPIDRDDLEALASSDVEQAVETIVKKWSQLPVTASLVCESNVYFRAACFHKDSEFVKELCKKHSILYIAPVANDSNSVFIKYGFLYADESVVERTMQAFCNDFSATFRTATTINRSTAQWKFDELSSRCEFSKPARECAEKWLISGEANKLLEPCVRFFYPQAYESIKSVTWDDISPFERDGMGLIIREKW